ncbi:MAG: methyl-accepting chemotaxis protein [Syntrophales bacterium]|nr:methyl-accepting chemotaxis protein [Syntrophales bacterium]
MWKSISIANKIWLSLGILCFGYFITVAYSFQSNRKIVSDIQYVSEYLLPAANFSRSAMEGFDEQVVQYNQTVLFGELSFIKTAGEISEAVQQSLSNIVQLKGISAGKASRIKELREQVKHFTKTAQSVYGASVSQSTGKDANSGDASEVKMLDMAEEIKTVSKELALLSDTFSGDLNEQLTTIGTSMQKVLWRSLIIFFLVVVGASVLIIAIIKKSVVHPIEETVGIVETIAEGNLSTHIDVKSDDEIGHLLRALNKMVKNLTEVLHLVSDTITKADSSASDILSAVEEQGSIAAEQSASVSEITATMEELAASSTEVAGHSNSVAAISGDALKKTKEGALFVENMTANMVEINETNKKNISDVVELGKKTEEITKVMEIINNIADQTKLIAFNAAIEASSAGESGKRFGVVAVEIRRLADNVMASTGETSRKIKEIQEAVNHMIVSSEKGSKAIEKGLEHSTETVAKLASIVEGAQATADAAKQISLATQQTKTATGNVLTGLREINQASKQLSGSIELIGNISKVLTGLSGSLKDLAGYFKFKQD